MSDTPAPDPSDSEKPASPLPEAASDSQEPPKKSRRDFLLGIGAGLNVVAGAMIGIPIVGFALSSFFRKKEFDWIALGPSEKYPQGQTRLATFKNPLMREWAGETAQMPCWVRHDTSGDFTVFDIHCTHLGCPVRWFQESKLFMCPCHGGVYYEDGSRASGPPPRGLYQIKHEVREDGMLYIYAGDIPSLANQSV